MTITKLWWNLFVLIRVFLQQSRKMPLSQRGNRIELETQVEFPEVDSEEVSTNVEEQSNAIPRTTAQSSVSTDDAHSTTGDASNTSSEDRNYLLIPPASIDIHPVAASVDQLAVQILLPVQEESDPSPQWDEEALRELQFCQTEEERVGNKTL